MQKNVLSAFLSLSGLVLTDAERRLLERYNPFGIILFNRNISSSDQLRRLTRTIRETVGHDRILIGIDQEGGRVNRLKSAGFDDYASQRTLGKINDTFLTAEHCRLMAVDMHSVGINTDFAPVLDREYENTSKVLLGRSFGRDPELILRHGRVVIETYLRHGICPCMKHIPGHGRAQTDPHLVLPKIEADLAELQEDFLPFRCFSDCPTAMTAHLLIPALDPIRPLTLSEKGIDFIRRTLGFRGILISDALDMHALSGTIEQKAQGAWSAGCDIVSYCGGKNEENEALCRCEKVLDERLLDLREKLFERLLMRKTSITLDKDTKRYYSLTCQFHDDDIQYDATETLHQMFKGE